jgi:hypothetical protein
MARDAGDQMTIERLEMQAKNAQETADQRGKWLEEGWATIARLEAQKADLLAALKSIIGDPRFWESSAGLSHLGPEARAAIERAESQK